MFCLPTLTAAVKIIRSAKYAYDTYQHIASYSYLAISSYMVSYSWQSRLTNNSQYSSIENYQNLREVEPKMI